MPVRIPLSAQLAGLGRRHFLRVAAAALGTALMVAPGFAKPPGLRLWSPGIKGPNLGMDQVFNGMGCTGKNISPELRWSGAPAGTKSFAVTVYDPDAPTGSGWWHWVVYNIPASAVAIPAGAGAANGRGLPAGTVQGVTDFGAPGFGGACPPKGDQPHRYVFTLYALKVGKLDVPATATAAMVGFNLHANSIAKAMFTERYGR
jgi:Raf kinase inhibitor-like YbhB/YbcL family protein